MPKTSPFSIRLSGETRTRIEEYAETLNMRPSTLAAKVIDECLDEWVKDYSEMLYERISRMVKKND